MQTLSHGCSFQRHHLTCEAKHKLLLCTSVPSPVRKTWFYQLHPENKLANDLALGEVKPCCKWKIVRCAPHPHFLSTSHFGILLEIPSKKPSSTMNDKVSLEHLSCSLPRQSEEGQWVFHLVNGLILLTRAVTTTTINPSEHQLKHLTLTDSPPKPPVVDYQ